MQNSSDHAGDATEALRNSMRALATSVPESLPAMAKDVGVLCKILRNPAETPEEPKFRTIKLTNPTIARVLAHTGVRAVLEACGFAEDAAGQLLTLSSVDMSLLQRIVKGTEEVRDMLQELHYLHAGVPSLVHASGWSADGASKAFVKACLTALREPQSRGTWVERLHHVLSAPEMHECRAVLSSVHSAVVHAVRQLALELINGQTIVHDVAALMHANKCLALLCPPGEAQTLDARLDFCYACLEAALPMDDELMELRLKLAKGSRTRPNPSATHCACAARAHTHTWTWRMQPVHVRAAEPLLAALRRSSISRMEASRMQASRMAAISSARRSPPSAPSPRLASAAACCGSS